MLKRQISDVSLADVFNEFKRTLLLNLNCHAVGIIQSFNPENQTCNVEIAYKKTVYSEVGIITQETVQDYPIIREVPVVVLGGGDYTIKCPIKQGDEALLLFNDRSIDDWFESGESLKLTDNRLHNFNDAIAIVGLRSLSRSLENYEENTLKIGNGNQELILNDANSRLRSNDSEVSISDKIMIKNKTQNLLDALILLCDGIINGGSEVTTTVTGGTQSGGSITGGMGQGMGVFNAATKMAATNAKEALEALLESGA